jgi:sterol desaturase/sphingolipid hydroxylase (fatty acid hydroxylase superfamily)
MTNELYFYAALASIGAFAGLLMMVLQWMVLSDKFKQYRIRTPENVTIPMGRKIVNVGLNMIWTLLIIFSAFYFMGDHLVHFNANVAGVTIFGEALAVLLFYDFMYYIMHRTLHHPKLMKYVHGIHHRARFPTAFESLFLHPVEAFGGLFVLFLSAFVIGPVSAQAMFLILFFHTVINILVHANMVLPGRIFMLSNFWAVKHDYHHGKHLNKNFASIFPFWDLMFGSYQ